MISGDICDGHNSTESALGRSFFPDEKLGAQILITVMGLLGSAGPGPSLGLRALTLSPTWPMWLCRVYLPHPRRVWWKRSGPVAWVEMESREPRRRIYQDLM